MKQHAWETDHKILAFVEHYTREHSCPPSYIEIMSACGLSSTSVVFHYLHRLQRQGFIKLVRRTSRSLVVVPLGRA